MNIDKPCHCEMAKYKVNSLIKSIVKPIIIFFLSIKFFIWSSMENSSNINLEKTIKRLINDNQQFYKMRYSIKERMKLLLTTARVFFYETIFFLWAIWLSYIFFGGYDLGKMEAVLTSIISVQGSMLFALIAFFPIATLLQGGFFSDSKVKYAKF